MGVSLYVSCVRLACLAQIWFRVSIRSDLHTNPNVPFCQSNYLCSEANLFFAITLPQPCTSTTTTQMVQIGLSQAHHRIWAGGIETAGVVSNVVSRCGVSLWCPYLLPLTLKRWKRGSAGPCVTCQEQRSAASDCRQHARFCDRIDLDHLVHLS